MQPTYPPFYPSATPEQYVPMRVTVYDIDLNRKGWLGAPESVSITIGHNLTGSAEVVIRSDHPRAADVLENGARLTFEMQGVSDPVLSGPITARKGEGPVGTSRLTLTVTGDWQLFHNLLAWPVPGAALTAQTSAYATYSGPGETVVKQVLADNLARVPYASKYEIAPDQGRGSSINIKFRFHPLYDRLFPAVEQAGIGVSAVQKGGVIVLDCYEPTTYPKTFSEAAGTILAWEWNRENPTVSRAVAGGQGEGVNRLFRSDVDVFRENEYGDPIERFLDQRNAEDAAELDEEISKELVEGETRTGLNLTLGETTHFKYGAVTVGDRITAKVGGLTLTDVLRSATFEYTRDNGLVITPQVGEMTDFPGYRKAKKIQQIEKTQRDRGTQ